MTARSDGQVPSTVTRRRDFELLETSEGTTEDGRAYSEALLLVPRDLVYFEGHFPGDPLLPGVVQMDRLAVARAGEQWPDLGPLEKIRRLKFIEPIRPGDRIRVRLERKKTPNQVALSIWSDESRCTTASLVFGLQDES